MFIIENNKQKFDFADAVTYTCDLEKRLKLAEGHIEAGRLLAFYQVCVFSVVDSDFENSDCITGIE